MRSHLTELVGELGEVVGPRVQRVDDLFRLLLGVAVPELESRVIDLQRRESRGVGNSTDHFIPIDAEKVGGSLGLLRERLGLEQGRVNTIEEERNFTNFLILVDHLQCLFQSWLVLRKGFVGVDGEVFFGTQLVLLSRSLGVVAESVEETYFAMNSVFLGPEERQTTRLELGTQTQPEAPITVAELLDWVKNVAAEEGPRLIQEGGKDGVIALTPTLGRLTDLVSKMFNLATRPSHNPTSAFHSVRVQRALEELTVHLQEATDLADDITRSRPTIAAVQPNSGELGETVGVDVYGQDFQEGARVLLRRTIAATQTERERTEELKGEAETFVSPGLIRADLPLEDLEESHVDDWGVVVVNPDGGEGTGGPFFVTEPDGDVLARKPKRPETLPPSPPQARSVDPDSGRQGDVLTVKVGGDKFDPDASLGFGPGIGVAEPSFDPESSTFTVEVNISPKAATGARDVSVTNPSGQKGALRGGFKVAAAKGSERQVGKRADEALSSRSRRT